MPRALAGQYLEYTHALTLLHINRYIPELLCTALETAFDSRSVSGRTKEGEAGEGQSDDSGRHGRNVVRLIAKRLAYTQQPRCA